MPHRQPSMAYKRFRGPFHRATVSPTAGRFIPSREDGVSMSEPEQTGNRQATESATETNDLVREAFRFGGA
jgi:hypothetical protein